MNVYIICTYIQLTDEMRGSGHWLHVPVPVMVHAVTLWQISAICMPLQLVNTCPHYGDHTTNGNWIFLGGEGEKIPKYLLKSYTPGLCIGTANFKTGLFPSVSLLIAGHVSGGVKKVSRVIFLPQTRNESLCTRQNQPLSVKNVTGGFSCSCGWKCWGFNGWIRSISVCELRVTSGLRKLVEICVCVCLIVM